MKTCSWSMWESQSKNQFWDKKYKEKFFSQSSSRKNCWARGIHVNWGCQRVIKSCKKKTDLIHKPALTTDQQQGKNIKLHNFRKKWCVELGFAKPMKLSYTFFFNFHFVSFSYFSCSRAMLFCFCHSDMRAPLFLTDKYRERERERERERLCFHENQNAVAVGVVLVKNLRQKNVRFWHDAKKIQLNPQKRTKNPNPWQLH